MRAAGIILIALCFAAPSLAQTPAPWPNGAFNPYDHMPIRVYIDASNLTASTLAYTSEVQAALSYWAAGGNGALQWNASFENATASNTSDIIVSFVELDNAPACGTGQAGGCGGYGGPSYGQPGAVQLATLLPNAPDDKRPPTHHIPYSEMRLVAEHEIGHALGLPHSRDQKDIMYPESALVNPYADSPDSTWATKNIAIVAGIFVGAAAVILGAQRLIHRPTRRTFDRATSAIESKKSRDPTPEERVILYARAPDRCASSPTGEHRFDARTLLIDGRSEQWFVCRDCRLPKRL